MRAVIAVYVRNEVEPGWPTLADNTPLGRRYTVDLDRVETMTLRNMVTGRSMQTECVWVLSPGRGWLPLLALRVEPDA